MLVILDQTVVRKIIRRGDVLNFAGKVVFPENHESRKVTEYAV